MAFSFDDTWDNSPEVIRAGTAAFGLYCRCGAWVARNLQDGFVPKEIAAAYGSPEWIQKLIVAGLWETCEGGYRMPHFFDRNESADQVRRRRKADAERKAKWRESKRGDRKSGAESRGVSRRDSAKNPRSLYPSPKGEEDARARDAGRRARPENPGINRTAAEALRHPSQGCEHGDPQGAAHCPLCRRGIPAQEVS